MSTKRHQKLSEQVALWVRGYRRTSEGKCIVCRRPREEAGTGGRSIGDACPTCGAAISLDGMAEEKMIARADFFEDLDYALSNFEQEMESLRS